MDVCLSMGSYTLVGLLKGLVILIFPRAPSSHIVIHIVNEATNCQRGNRAKKRGFLGGRIITPRNVGKNSQILRNPLKFAFLTIFGCKIPYLGGDVIVLFLQLVVRNWVIQCAAVSVQEDLTGEQALIRFLV